MVSYLTKDEELLRRAAQDKDGTLAEMVARRLREDIRPSFDEAYRRMSTKGRPGLFVLKSGSVAMGSLMMADGVYHIISGNDERTQDLFVNAENTRNYTRIFAGLCNLSAGAMMAYLGASKGPIGKV